jgi:hypothetical protein
MADLTINTNIANEVPERKNNMNVTRAVSTGLVLAGAAFVPDL